MAIRREYRLIITTNNDGSESMECYPVGNFGTLQNIPMIRTDNYLIDLVPPRENTINTRDLIFEDVIVSMSTYDFDRIHEWDTLADELCTICAEDVCSQSTVKDLECGHIFHISCLRRHCCMYSVKCPNCRLDLRQNIH